MGLRLVEAGVELVFVFLNIAMVCVGLDPSVLVSLVMRKQHSQILMSIQIN